MLTVGLACLSGCGPERASTALVDSVCAPDAAPAVTCTAGPHRSPFTCVRFNRDCSVDVQLEEAGAWFHWDGIDRIHTPGLVALAKQHCAATWKMRVAEDLGALLAGACAPLEATARLTLREVDTGVTRVVTADVTEENRARVKACWPTVDACK